MKYDCRSWERVAEEQGADGGELWRIIRTVPSGRMGRIHVSSIECCHSRHKQFRHKQFFRKKLVYSHGDVFIRLSSQLWSPLVGAVALFILSLLHATGHWY